MSRLRLVVAALLPAVAASLLAGCAGVPTSGPIEQGPSVAAPGGDQFIRVIARPPRAGMTPEEVVRGFQEATASQDTGFTVARQYLTSLANATWTPSRGVRVYDNSGLTLQRTGSDVSASGSLAGDIDPEGQLSVAAPGATLQVKYGLTLVDGEWRIQTLPDGLVLGRGDIDRSYRSFELFYLTRDFTRVVPAPVTLPLSDAGQATQLVSALLAGPTRWIAPAVRSAFPQGTKLTLDSVPVVDGIADVDLTSEALAADDPTRQALSAQLVWTLKQLPDISGVRITVNGQPFLVPGVGPVQDAEDWKTYDPDAVPDSFVGYAVGAGQLIAVARDGTLSIVRPLAQGSTLPGVALDGSAVAALSPDRRQLWLYDREGVAPGLNRYTGTELSRPSWDPSGSLWVVDRGRGLVLVTPEAVTRVAITGLPDGVADDDVVAAAVSRDGTRMALLVQRGTRVEPMLARIERAADRVRVAAPRRVDSVVSDALDIAWSDSGALVVLGSSGSTTLEVHRFEVGTLDARRFGAPEGATTVAAGPTRPLLVGTPDGLFSSVGTTFTRLGDAADPVYPG